MSKIKSAVDAFVEQHPVCATLCVAIIVFALLSVTFWFVVFSGISSSADFIYSHF
jgi:hypothetical protein